jgi:NAD(P)-dependent dehydrogenase (short-subunit alcohol dehydrogenase family)
VNNIVIIGATGALGNALITEFATEPKCCVHAVARRTIDFQQSNIRTHTVDLSCENSLQLLAQSCSENIPIDAVIVAIGLLHNESIQPEKTMRQLKAANLQQLYMTNAILPLLVAKNFLPKMDLDNPSIFAALSARVGSISDNKLAGWYGYRASKAALNMLIKNAAIEQRRRNKKSIVVTLHPGTVDSQLSQPYQRRLKEGQLFSPTDAASKLVAVLNKLRPQDSGKCFDWKGEEILP